MLNDKVILVTGGTGSFGNMFTEKILNEYTPRKVIIYSRDEFKQYTMKQRFSRHLDRMRFFLGDVRDRNRLARAFEGVDYVVHAAALKQVPALEYNPTEAVKTNIVGAENIVDAAIDSKVKKVIALSTDKAASPINLYGATKLVAEKIFISANSYSGGRVAFAAVRYGNVMGSRGSVIPLFMNLRSRGINEFPITDERMTRFWITLEQSANLVIKALQEAEGGEMFIPIIPSMKITDLARAIAPDCSFRFTGIRAGEKLHETLICHDEARNAKRFQDIYIVLPQFVMNDRTHQKYAGLPNLPDDFEYRSDTNDMWIGSEEIMDSIKEMKFD